MLGAWAGVVKYLHFRNCGVFYEKEEYESLSDIHNNCFLPENNSTYEVYENALHSAMSIALRQLQSRRHEIDTRLHISGSNPVEHVELVLRLR